MSKHMSAQSDVKNDGGRRLWRRKKLKGLKSVATSAVKAKLRLEPISCFGNPKDFLLLLMITRSQKAFLRRGMGVPESAAAVTVLI